MTQLDRIEEKLDRLLYLLEGGKTSYSIRQEAKKVIQLKLDKTRIKGVKKENGGA